MGILLKRSASASLPSHPRCGGGDQTSQTGRFAALAASLLRSAQNHADVVELVDTHV
ncbi:MAG: hypothetical protein RLZZ611_1006 [Cyanobacteriota bacterium]